MHITQAHLKTIALGLIPVFFILSVLLPKTLTSAILLGIIMIAAIVISFIGMSREKCEAGEGENLLAIPPKKL
jgi:hypothetical protein